jgi:regulation of enolase protein 1 (concanavalin A-like superfamily)
MAPQGLNLVQDAPKTLSHSIVLKVPANTDIWRTPPKHNAFNAPIIAESLSLSLFRSARVTISLPHWSQKFDQGGFFFLLGPELSDSLDHQWIKTGIEVYEGAPFVSVVATDRWSDWSLVPSGGKTKVTIELERDILEGGELGSTLWIYLLGEDGKRQPLREVSWVFKEAGDKDKVCWVGIAGARPSTATKDELEVEFSDFKIVTG